MSEEIITIQLSDEDIITFMLQAKNVKDWNQLRESVKEIRSQEWITINLDSSGLIKKCNFK